MYTHYRWLFVCLCSHFLLLPFLKSCRKLEGDRAFPDGLVHLSMYPGRFFINSAFQMDFAASFCVLPIWSPGGRSLADLDHSKVGRGTSSRAPRCFAQSLEAWSWVLREGAKML